MGGVHAPGQGRSRTDAQHGAELRGGRAVRAPLCVAAAALLDEEWTGRGLLLAATSGAITSGLGYAIWYAALRGHSRTSAAAVQLTVPLIAAAGGVALLGERATSSLAVSAALILGGVGLTLARPRATAS